MWDIYQRSVPMSTYIVAFMVSDFDHITSNDTEVMLVTTELEAGEDCKNQHFALSPGTFGVQVPEDEADGTFGQLHIPYGKLELEGTFFLCLKANGDSSLVHQGPRKAVTLKVFTPVLPMWIKIIF